jgi:hypothetical protein
MPNYFRIRTKNSNVSIKRGDYKGVISGYSQTTVPYIYKINVEKEREDRSIKLGKVKQRR